MKSIIYFISVLVLLTTSAFADVPVEDAQPNLPKVYQVRVPPSKVEQARAAQQKAQNEQIMQLQQNIQDLKVLIEMQGKQIQQLQASQLNMYNELSQKIARQQQQFNAQQNHPAPIVTNSSAPKLHTDVLAQSTVTQDGKLEYQYAYGLVEKQQYTDAVPALEAVTKKYPHSVYAGEAYYWLGQLDAIAGNNKAALENFNQVVANYPHTKEMPDTMLKLGLLEADAGNDQQAKVWLAKVVRLYPKTTAAHLAKVKLQQIEEQ